MNRWKLTFAVIWSGEALSLLSSSMVQFALVWWLTKETGSVSVLAIASIAAMLPQVLLAPFIGVWVDRFNRKAIMIISDLTIALFSLIVAILYHFGMIEVWHIYIALAIRSIGSGFYMPAMQASVPLIAPEEQLTRVSAVNQVLQSISMMAGPALGAILISISSMEVAMSIDVICAVIASITLLLVKIPNPVREYADTNVIQEMKDGLKAILSNKPLSILMLTYVLCVFSFMPAGVLAPLVTFDYFKGGAAEMSIVEVAFGIGMIAGAAVLGVIGENKRKVLTICAAYIIFGLMMLITGLLPATGFIIFVGLALIMGVTMPMISTPITVILQTNIEPDMLGRVFTLYTNLSLAPSILALVVTTFIGDALGIMLLFVISGVLCTAIGVVALMVPSLRRLG
ncbi:MAG: MFS transporter [Deferribacteraceae bacterium]|jgi:DHA3 family macrolide efflux protein-like MFS transporter|nr:MFS transporter [Deferribacteraceae bacterium]